MSSDIKSIKIPVDHLVVGLFVDLELGWTEHPFTFSKFKITNEKEIKIIKSLGLSEVRVIATKSDVPLPLDKPKEMIPEATDEDVEAISQQWDEKNDYLLQAIELREKRRELTKEYKQKEKMIHDFGKDMKSKPANAIHQVDDIVDDLVAGIINNDDLLTNLVSLGHSEYSESNHTANVSMLSLMIGAAENLSLSDMNILASGALLHDIGMITIPANIKMKKNPLSVAEQKIYQQHPTAGRKLIEMVKKLDSRVLSIIEQHHEYLDGSGYPYGIKEGGISKLVRIVTIADLYDRLCNPVDITKALTPKVALATLYKKFETQLDRQLIQKFVATLGIYPPGTVVKLSDGNIGLVISVEKNYMQKPDVIVYDSTTAKEDATIIRLKQHDDISIENAMSAGTYPHEIHDYFKLSERIGYMIKSQDL
ncbi:MAG: DUF3391 domain-containing protein [Gammaproteobacteria bacterium]|nr:DUF3391 domain-containing protein [Gammaproteobacteria bacterium]